MQASEIFLTFDDGPHPTATREVLTVLESHNVVATFFLSGCNISGNESLVQDIASAGHAIGIHAYTHTRALVFSEKKTRHEIQTTERAISALVPLRSKLFRPPFGFFSWNTITAARKLEYKLIMWSCLTGDFRTHRSNKQIISTATKKLSGGDILVFHDNDVTKHRIAAILHDTIQFIKDSGFSFGIIT